MFGLRIDSEGIGRPLRVKFIPFTAPENRANTRPCIRRQTRARNWIPQSKCAKHSPDGVIVIDSFVNKCRNRLVLEDIETRLAAVQNKSLKTDTSIATEEIFNVATATPGVIAANVTVIRTQHRTAFTGTLNDVNE